MKRKKSIWSICLIYFFVTLSVLGNETIELKTYAKTIIPRCLSKQIEIDDNQEDYRGKYNLTQEMINNATPNFIIQKNYDLHNKVLIIPEGCTLDFQGGSVNNGTLILKSNTVIKGNNAECVASYDGLSHKSLIVVNNAENIKIYNLTLKGNYNEDRDGAVNPWGQIRKDGHNLLFIGNANNIQIEGLRVDAFVNDNQGIDADWNIKDSTNTGFAAVKIVYSTNVLVKNCKEVHSAGEGWEFNYCEDVTIDSLSIERKYGVSSLNVEGCHNFTMQNSTFVTEFSTGDIANILAKNAIVHNCVFKSGGVDFGNEFANRGYERIIRECSYNVTFSNCYFGGDLRNGSCVVEKSPSKIVDGLKVKNCTFHIDASVRNNIIALYLGNNGNIGTVLFENNTIEVTGKANKNFDYYYQIIESYSRTYTVDTLIIRGNKIYDDVFIKKRHYDNIVRRHLNGVIIATNANSLVVENNNIKSCSDIICESTILFPGGNRERVTLRNNQLAFVRSHELSEIKNKIIMYENQGNTIKALKYE